MCRSKHVEQLRNTGIINSTTLLHLFGYFYKIYIMMHGSMNIKFPPCAVTSCCRNYMFMSLRDSKVVKNRVDDNLFSLITPCVLVNSHRDFVEAYISILHGFVVTANEVLCRC